MKLPKILLLSILLFAALHAAGAATDLQIVLTADNELPIFGETTTFTITATNHGPERVTNLSLDDAVPVGVAGFTLGTINASSGTSYSDPTWTIGTLEIGATATLTIEVSPGGASLGTTLTNAITNISLSQVDNNASPDTLSVDIDIHSTSLEVDNSTGSGCSDATGAPFCTIQTAVDSALLYSRIDVMPGSYDECVDADPSTGDRPLSLVGVGGPDVTTIDASSCPENNDGDPLNNLAAVEISSTRARVQGFTITGGEDAGIFARGPIKITNNIIDGNLGDLGGGIFFYSQLCNFPTNSSVIANNQVKNNSAEGGAGGGIYAIVGTTNPSIACSGAHDLVIEGNTVDANRVGADGFGAGLWVKSSSNPTNVLTITITGNEISNNFMDTALPAYGRAIWSGAGAYVSTFGYGSETINVLDNNIHDNRSTYDGGGLASWIQTYQEGRHAMILRGNEIRDNRSDGNAGGVDIFVNPIDFDNATFSNQQLSFTAEGNLVDSNTASGVIGSDGGGGGGMLAFFFPVSTSENLIPMEVELRGNTVTNNTAGVSGGGMSIIAVADADPPGSFSPPAPPGPTEATVTVQNNLVAGNRSLNVGGGVFVAAEAFGAGTATVEMPLNTISSNLTTNGAGGIEVEHSSFDDLSGNQGLGQVGVYSSILSGNQGPAIGGPAQGDFGVRSLTGLSSAFNLEFELTYTDLFGHPGGEIEPGFRSSLTTINQQNNLAIDPQLDSDFVPVQLPGSCNQTIDAGDPLLALLSADEPRPNGGAVNLGHTGGTAEATTSIADIDGDRKVDGLDVLFLRLGFTSGTGQPRYDAMPAADLNGDFTIGPDDLSLIGRDYLLDCNP